MSLSIYPECPCCGLEHDVTLHVFDMEGFEEIECDCGCEFTVDWEIDYDTTVHKNGNPDFEKDIPFNDPNQLTLFDEN